MMGSSPRMRGALPSFSSDTSRSRIIPAYAGSTPTPLGGWTASWDHPRVCGEHRLEAIQASNPGGSSPRMRGAHPHGPESTLHVGIIPAYAGSTVEEKCAALRCWDHPRVCGEHGGSICQALARPGSSPRMRGAHFTKCIAAIVKPNSYTVVKVRPTSSCYNISYL